MDLLMRELHTLHPVSYTHLDVYKRQEQTQPKLDALNAAEAALEHAFSRWEELEALKHQD